MATIIETIVASKRREIEESRSRLSTRDLQRRLDGTPPVRDFRAALERPGTIQVIAEIKKASPSAGLLRADFDPLAIARIYARHGAAAISVLTDAPFFQGHLSDLTSVREVVSLPLLRKDFIIDGYQLLEARAAGADAVLLIAEILSYDEMKRLLHQTRELGMQALVELHDAANLQVVLDGGASMIGINNRDLHTFVTRLEHSLELAERCPADCCLVSESGIRNRQDVLRLDAAGFKAVLVGETLMRTPDIGSMLDDLLGR
jgi:indole-3-glycerol phosphate synthase